MPSALPIILYTPYFSAAEAARQAELDECLRRNVNNHALTKIVLLVDDDAMPPLASDRIQIVKLSARPTYLDWVRITRSQGQRHLSLLANTDIYFDDSVAKLREVLAAPETFVALSRYDRIEGRLEQHPNPEWSQDTWAFDTASEISEAHATTLNFPLGVPRCDNKVAYLFAVRGWRVCNPVRFINSVHVHETQLRTYNKKTDLTILGGVAHVHPESEIGAEARLELSIWGRNASRLSTAKVNPSIDRWLAGAQAEQPVEATPALRPLDLSPAEAREFIRTGSRVFSHLARFEVFAKDSAVLVRDALTPPARAGFTLARSGPLRIDEPAVLQRLLAAWVPPVVSNGTVPIKDRPDSPADCLFWQYPAATEKQACDNHLQMAAGANIDASARVCHVYVPVPWATFVDKKATDSAYLAVLRVKLMGYRGLVERLGYTFRAHTVCQHIHWRRMVETVQSLGITDLHLSHRVHATPDDLKLTGSLTVHSWPLIAVNMENADRREGLTPDVAPGNRKYLASFVGAHMPHYRSDVRVRLAEFLERRADARILVKLTGEWHFNKRVYKEQVASKALTESENAAENEGTLRYNEVLSQSVFSFCPEGAGPNTLRLWEALSVGSIPVVIADDWIAPHIKGAPLQLKDCAFTPRAAELEGFIDNLDKIPMSTIEKMHANGVKLYGFARSARCF